MDEAKKPGVIETAVRAVKRLVKDHPCPKCGEPSRFLDDCEAAGTKFAAFMCMHTSSGTWFSLGGDGKTRPCQQTFFAVFEDGSTFTSGLLSARPGENSISVDSEEIGVQRLKAAVDQELRRRADRARRETNIRICINQGCAARGMRMPSPFCIHCGKSTGRGKPGALRCGNDACQRAQWRTEFPKGAFCETCGTALVDKKIPKNQETKLEARG